MDGATGRLGHSVQCAADAYAVSYRRLVPTDDVGAHGASTPKRAAARTRLRAGRRSTCGKRLGNAMRERLRRGRYSARAILVDAPSGLVQTKYLSEQNEDLKVNKSTSQIPEIILHNKTYAALQTRTVQLRKTRY
jgi:hypothetical protein